jgi:hypothetical protein
MKPYSGSRIAYALGRSYLFSSSLANRKEKQVATEQRLGDNCSGGPALANPHCTGTWLGGLVSSGSQILANRWTTDGSGAVTDGALYAVTGARVKQVADGPDTIQASSTDGNRVAVLRSDGTVAVYPLSGGAPLTSGWAHGNVAVYSKPVRFKADAVSVGAIRAINLTTGKDSLIGTLGGAIALAEIDSAGLVYASSGYGAVKAGNGTLVVTPFARVSAAVG